MVRVKSRYLLCQVHVPDRKQLLLLDDRAVAAAVRDAVWRIHGDYGAAVCSLRFSVMYLNAHTGIVFLRFLKKYYRLLWSALPFITCIETRGQKISCFLNCLHVGGTMRTCQKFLIQYNKRQLHLLLQKNKSKEEETVLRNAILSCTIPGGEKETSEDEVDWEEDEK